MNEAIDQLAREIDDFYANIRDVAVIPSVTPQLIREHLVRAYDDFSTPRPLTDVMRDVSRMMRDWTIHPTHPRYFGLFNPAIHRASIFADAMVALYNPQLAAWSHAPAANEIERYTLAFLARQIGFDPETSGANFCSGGAEANFSAVLVALAQACPEYLEHGMSAWNGRVPRIYVSCEGHHSFLKIAQMAGLGRSAVRMIGTDARLKLDVPELARQISEDRWAGDRPLIVIGTAGTTGAGIIDELDDLADVAAREKLWFHVDAAWGGAAVLSPTLKPHLAGIERADSITWDAHKWLSVPMGAGMFFCRRKEMLGQAFGIHTGYMPAKIKGVEDPYDFTMQWTRRFMGLKLFLPMAQLGAGGMRELIEHQASMGDLLKEKLRRADWIVVNDTPLPLACFTHDRIRNGSINCDEILARLYSRRNTWISQVRVGGEPALRACITSFRTDESDLDVLIDELNRAVGDL